MSRMQELIEQCTHVFEGAPQIGIDSETTVDAEKLYALVVVHAIDCVRDVLRADNTDLTYKAASEVQERIREFFEI